MNTTEIINQLSILRKELADEGEVANITGYSIPWLRIQRKTKKGPSFIKFGHQVYYVRSELNGWVKKKSNKQAVTAQF